MGYFKFNLICLLIVLTINLNYAAEGKDEKFPNFYAAPANLELIAMDSQRSTNQQSATSSSSSKSSSKSSSSSEEDDSGEPRFSIGLGTLAPSYSQKFGLDGNTRLDFDHHNNGFSYTLTNHHHPQPNSFSDLSKDEFFGQPSNQQFSQSEHSSKPNIKIYYNQRYHSIPSPPPPSSPLSSTAESKNFFSALPPSPRSFDFSPSTRSKSNKIPDESRFRELVDKYAPKEEEDSLESFFKKDLTPKGSWNSLSDRPSFDHMPHDMPDEMPEHHQPHPHHHYDSEPQTSTPPPLNIIPNIIPIIILNIILKTINLITNLTPILILILITQNQGIDLIQHQILPVMVDPITLITINNIIHIILILIPLHLHHLLRLTITIITIHPPIIQVNHQEKSITTILVEDTRKVPEVQMNILASTHHRHTLDQDPILKTKMFPNTTIIAMNQPSAHLIFPDQFSSIVKSPMVRML
ncbi:uncharacterized protein LOC128393169 isoform X2 [Panonychus citri]|uniref:uncharacterized protein LOC128393169 isoform X2 n=1 Tax=Panonychus citri TaxID=50023 RepID=UPI0023080955|nr:uncharacterized protein LOC128393169 isoform X2 [Panonychus citri]